MEVDHAGAVDLVGHVATGSDEGTTESNNRSSVSDLSSLPHQGSPWTVGSVEGNIQHPEQSHRNHAIIALNDRFNQYHNLGVSSAMAASPPLSLPVGGAAIIGATGEGSLPNPSATMNNQRSLYQDRILHQTSSSVESVLAASCEVMGFDIAEMWLRTGPKTHQLTNSHLRPTALEDSVRKELVDVYYGERSSERTHRLSPALCKRAKEANDVVWVTAHTAHGAEALRCSISDVRTAVAVPVCHEASNTNMTIIYFSIRR